jgi:hypothetical protein
VREKIVKELTEGTGKYIDDLAQNFSVSVAELNNMTRQSVTIKLTRFTRWYMDKPG